MTFGVGVANKQGKFFVEFRFHDKDKTIVADSSESFNSKEEANNLARTWSKSYNATLEN